MNEHHLSAFEQEEYILGERTPEMLRHLTNCAQCMAAVSRVENGLACYRSSAVEWSEDCSSNRSWLIPSKTMFLPITALRWAMAGVLPVVLVLLALVAFHIPSHVEQPQAAISDDALLEQVDDQLSVSVPSSMESLTHLVTAQDGRRANAEHDRSKNFVETN